MCVCWLVFCRRHHASDAVADWVSRYLSISLLSSTRTFDQWCNSCTYKHAVTYDDIKSIVFSLTADALWSSVISGPLRSTELSWWRLVEQLHWLSLCRNVSAYLAISSYSIRLWFSCSGAACVLGIRCFLHYSICLCTRCPKIISRS